MTYYRQILINTKMNFCFFILFFAYVFSSTSSSIEKEWNDFKAKYNKHYQNKTEEQYRKEIFERQLREVEGHNELYRKGLLTWAMGINNFSDWTEDELSSSFGVAVIPSSETNDLVENKAHVEVAPDYDIPKEVNWTRRRAVTAVKNLGGCYIDQIFVVAASIESHWFLKTGELVDLSVQNIMDCANSTIDSCEATEMTSMNMDKIFQYVIENQGIATEKSYPYEKKRGECRYNPEKRGAYISSVRQVRVGDENALKHAVAAMGPVTASIYTFYTAHKYTNGVYYNPKCLLETSGSVFRLLIVGYGTEKGEDFWLGKAFWGENWGEKGYMKVARNKKNHCGIATHAFYPVMDDCNC